MTPRRLRLRALLALGIAAAIALTLLIAERASRAVLRSALEPRLDPAAVESVLDRHTRTFFGIGVAALALGAIAGFALAHRVTANLGRLRQATLMRARGEQAHAQVDFAELQSLASAIDLLATELADTAESLTRERDDLALLLATVGEGILQIDDAGRVVTVNPAARTLLGLPAAVEGQPIASLVRNTDLRRFLELLPTASETATREISVDDRRLLITGRPMPGQPGARSVGAVVAFTDLTELRRLEGVRRDFVANVSHEIKTPLTSIRGYVETLLGDELPPAVHRQFLEVIEKNAERLHRIVDDLLDLSRLESGGWRPELQPVDALEIAEDAWSHCRDRARDKRIDFRREGDATRVVADPSALRHVFSNLFDNAIRHTPDGGRITVRATRLRNGAAPLVNLEVRDTGSGIPSDSLPRVFERFYRVDPARSRADGGTGLGLSIVKHLVESMGGQITAESELGKGTTMRVRLPAA